MATADKTKQKLVESMRKSKSGAARKPAAKPAASKPASGSRATPAKKTSTRRAPARKAAQPKRPLAAAAMTAVTWQASMDPYQSDGRIWPD